MYIDGIISAFVGVLALILLIWYGSREKRGTAALKGTISGILSLSAAHFILAHFGHTLPLSLFNCCFSAIFGIPGAILIVLCAIFL